MHNKFKIQKSELKDRQYNGQKEKKIKRQKVIYKALNRNLNIEQHEHH